MGVGTKMPPFFTNACAVQRGFVLHSQGQDALAGVAGTHRFPLAAGRSFTLFQASSNSTTARSARTVVRSRSRVRLAASNQAASLCNRSGVVKASVLAWASARSAAAQAPALSSPHHFCASSTAPVLPAASCFQISTDFAAQAQAVFAQPVVGLAGMAAGGLQRFARRCFAVALLQPGQCFVLRRQLEFQALATAADGLRQACRIAADQPQVACGSSRVFSSALAAERLIASAGSTITTCATPYCGVSANCR